MPGRSEQQVPTNVTAEVKSQTNRARSVAAGVVSGAGSCQPVMQTPHSDESAPSRTGRSLDPRRSAKASKSRVPFQQGS